MSTRPKDVAVGQNAVADGIINALGRSPYWPRLALFVTWDDYGGFYDHVAPPQVDSEGYGSGYRASWSPPTRAPGYLDATVYDHTSILRFVEERFGLPTLSARDAAAAPIGPPSTSRSPRVRSCRSDPGAPCKV